MVQQKSSSKQSKSSSNKKGGAVDLAIPFVPLALLTALKAMRDNKKGGSSSQQKKRVKGGSAELAGSNSTLAPLAPPTTGKSAAASPALPELPSAPHQAGGKRKKQRGGFELSHPHLAPATTGRSASASSHPHVPPASTHHQAGGKSKSKAKRGGSADSAMGALQAALQNAASQNNNLLRGGRKYKGGFFSEDAPTTPAIEGNPFAPKVDADVPEAPKVDLQDPTVAPMAPPTTGKSAQAAQADAPVAPQAGGKKKASKKASSSKKQKKQRGGEVQMYANQLNDIVNKMNNLMK